MISSVRIRTQATAALTLARSLVSGAYALGRLSGFPLIPVYSEQSRRSPPSSADNRLVEFEQDFVLRTDISLSLSGRRNRRQVLCKLLIFIHFSGGDEVVKGLRPRPLLFPLEPRPPPFPQ
jgi:hypothetical protein